MKTLVILTHPDMENSKTNKRWKEELLKYPEEITVHDLYEEYPDEKIDVEKEQKLLEKYEHIIFQFPLYWFNVPGFLKKWLDKVLLLGWAYGPEGDKMKNKKIGLAVTVGGKEEYYSHTGANHFSINEILIPIRNSIRYVDAVELPYYAIFGVSPIAVPPITEKQMNESAEKYIEYIRKNR